MLKWTLDYLTYNYIQDKFGYDCDMISGSHYSTEISFYKIYISEKNTIHIYSRVFNGLKSLRYKDNGYFCTFDTLEEAKAKAFEWLIEISRTTLEEINRKIYLERELT